jgi:hypothetical protein
MPDVSLNRISSWSTSTCIVNICPEKYVESVCLEGTDGLTEQTCSDEEEEVGHNDEEDT